eukprot:gene3424-4046_t
MKKITRAMELIAASRIIKAQQRAQAAAPYARELTRAVSAVATFSNVDHPLTREEDNPVRAAVLIVTSDRGLAGAYSSSVLKEAERLADKIHIIDHGRLVASGSPLDLTRGGSVTTIRLVVTRPFPPGSPESLRTALGELIE